MTKILATSDNHLGFRQYGLVEREKDIEKAFSCVVLEAVSAEVDAITVSGDILHSTRPTSRTMAFLAHMHQTLRAQSIPCYIISGNHDKSEPHWIQMLGDEDDHLDWGFLLIDDRRIEVGDITIYGQPFISKSEWKEKCKSIPEVDILLMHQSFSEFTFANPETSFYPKDLEKLKVKTIVMGDTHVTETHVLDKTGAVVISPGSTELISSSEPIQKHAVLLTKTSPPVGTTDRLGHEIIPIRTRMVVRGTVENEEDVRGMVGLIGADILGESDNTYDYPLVFLEYTPNVAHVINTIRRQWPGIMLRARPKKQLIAVEEKSKVSDEDEAADILCRMLPGTTHKSTDTLAHELLNPECDVNMRIDDYVKRRLDESKFGEAVVERVINKIEATCPGTKI